jgi:hypothetical protein
MIRANILKNLLAAGLFLGGSAVLAVEGESGRAPVDAPRPTAAAPADKAAAADKTAPAERDAAEKVTDGAEEFKPDAGKPKGLSGSALGGNDKWMDDPFRNIVSDMKGIISDLDIRETHVPSTETQPRVLSRLDVLIAQLEKACKGGGGAAGNNPTRPANVSTLGGGPGGIGELRAPGDSKKKWAELTPKEREKILQSQSQGFPAGYEDLLSEYFRRLSQGKTVAASAAEQLPTNDRAKSEPAKSAAPATGAEQ